MSLKEVIELLQGANKKYAVTQRDTLALHVTRDIA